MSEPTTFTDAALVRLTLDGDQSAFRVLVQRYQGLMFTCALSATRNRADAADATQDAFIRFHRHLDQYDCRRPLKPYLLVIAVNCARSLVRARRRAEERTVADAVLDQVRDERPGPAKSHARRERGHAVRALVAALPGTAREVITLFYLAGCSCREVAEILGMSEAAVKVALHRARKRLLEADIREWRTV